MASSPTRARTERLKIAAGRLGPLRAPCVIEPRPFTVFIGPQGTGKSLAAQILYAFRDLGRLAPYADAALVTDKRRSNGDALREVLNGLRSRQGYFSAFLDHGTQIEYQAESATRVMAPVEAFSVTKSKTEGGRPTVDLELNQTLALRLGQARKRKTRDWNRAIFVPTERLLYSELSDPVAIDLLRPPVTFTFFAQQMAIAGSLLAEWGDGREPDTEQGRRVRELARAALGGEVVRKGNEWKWWFADGTRKGKMLDVDMASSGQKANWPLVLLAEAMFTWRKEGKIGARTTIYVEEPEIHLHPQAQRSMVEILAMLVRAEFRVVLTTHSLMVLYTVNNLVQAGRLKSGVDEAGLPAPDVRLSNEDVEAVLFRRDGTTESLVNRENGFINEAQLGEVSAELQDQMNHIASLIPRKGRR